MFPRKLRTNPKVSTRSYGLQASLALISIRLASSTTAARWRCARRLPSAVDSLRAKFDLAANGLGARWVEHRPSAYDISPGAGFDTVPEIPAPIGAGQQARASVPPKSLIVVLGDSMADWLAYGLEDAFSDTPELLARSSIASSIA
jgi:hypothetical protein